jgi:hypothetical protein
MKATIATGNIYFPNYPSLNGEGFDRLYTPVLSLVIQ